MDTAGGIDSYHTRRKDAPNPNKSPIITVIFVFIVVAIILYTIIASIVALAGINASDGTFKKRHGAVWKASLITAAVVGVLAGAFA